MKLMRCNLIKGAFQIWSPARRSSAEGVRVQRGHGEETLARSKEVLAKRDVSGRRSGADATCPLRLGTVAGDWQNSMLHIFNKEGWKMLGVILYVAMSSGLVSDWKNENVDPNTAELHWETEGDVQPLFFGIERRRPCQQSSQSLWCAITLALYLISILLFYLKKLFWWQCILASFKVRHGSYRKCHTNGQLNIKTKHLTVWKWDKKT